ncbi:DoxX family protein [Rubrobacter tropicus]|uniref:DoxX family protein n=1 Tax=Rubrobacter tropicus TaxID=2653851 RepID=A0A6G8QBX6_9ACTN|nr:DoxX family protein [Rubrobacter tropicus]QIN83979.1 DoxX family protein [Rubrobacter tropicus]
MGSSFSRASTGLVFVVAGLLHYAAPAAYEKIMPPYLPLHRELVYLSGACEVLGGLGLFPKRTRTAAGIGLILLLISVLPANVQMLLDARAAGKPSWWTALLWLRLPLQLALVAWVRTVSRSRD